MISFEVFYLTREEKKIIAARFYKGFYTYFNKRKQMNLETASLICDIIKRPIEKVFIGIKPNEIKHLSAVIIGSVNEFEAKI
jgi:hypothetical protein